MLGQPFSPSDNEIQAGKKILRFLQEILVKKESLISKLTWMTGTNGERCLPLLKYTNFALIPTGQLLDERIAPLAGEQGEGIRAADGVNQTCLSGVESQDFDTAWNYANYRKESVALLKLEEACFKRARMEFDYQIASYDKSGFFNFHAAENLAMFFLKMRQFNEKRYQKEFVETKEVDKLLSIINNDNNFYIFEVKDQAEKAIEMEIPENVRPGNDPDCVNLIKFLTEMEQQGYKGYAKEAGYIKGNLGYPQVTPADLIQKSKRKLEYGYIQRVLFEQPSLAYFILHVRTADERYIQENLQLMHKVLNKYIDGLNNSRRRLKAAIEQGPKFEYATIEQECRSLRKLPIVLGSTKVLPVKKGGMHGERLYEGSLTIGKELNIIITDKDKQVPLQRYLATKGLIRPKVNLTVCTKDQVEKAFEHPPAPITPTLNQVEKAFERSPAPIMPAFVQARASITFKRKADRSAAPWQDQGPVSSRTRSQKKRKTRSCKNKKYC